MNELTQEFIRNINFLLENGYNPRDVARYSFYSHWIIKPKTENWSMLSIILVE